MTFEFSASVAKPCPSTTLGFVWMSGAPLPTRVGKLRKLFALAATALFCACGGGDLAANGGMSGTGISQGVITGFGSVFVNGVEWEIDGADIEIDDVLGLESELEIGMRVTVNGTVSADGLTGVATALGFEADVEGPIESISMVGNDGDQVELIILGRTIVIDRSSTTFDDSDVTFTFDTMAVNDLVEVSGLLDASGSIAATRIEKEGTLVLGTTEVEFKGTIGSFAGGSTFVINGVTVTFDPSGSTTDLSELPGGVVNGTYVEIEGVFDAPNAVTATEIEEEDEGLGDDVGDAELEGFIASFVSASDFMVSGQSVNASGATLIPNNASLLADGAKVKVKGSVVGVVLVADEIEFRGNYIRVSAEISMLADIDLTENTVTLLGIVVTVDNSTRLKDDTGNLETQGLAFLAAGDFLEVRGFPDGLGGIVATRLELEDDSSDEVELRGFVDSFDAFAKTITILGVTVPTDETTDFEDSDDIADTEAGFFAALMVGDLVELEGDEDALDKSIFDLAVEVEFEDR